MPDEPGQTFPDIPYGGAPNVLLFLTANGTAIEGDSLQKTREGAIECVYFSSSVATTRVTSGSGMATGRRTHGPIVIRKRIDKATPLLAKALVQNEVVVGTFKFFRLAEDGTEQHFFTIEFDHGRVAAQTTYSPDNVAASGQAGQAPFMEEVRFVYQLITWRYDPDGIEFEDSWGMF
jgi:type VI secretion system secreted protein Hcp